MVDKIDMSLDDIIKSNKGGGAGRRGGRGGPPRKGGRPGVGGFRSQQRSGPVGGPNNGVGARTLKGRTRGGITRSRFPRGDVNSAWKHDLYDGPKRAGGMGGGGGGGASGAKLLVSNLDYGVSESDINELFAEFGPLKSASVHYDRSGRSLGTADVVFERRSDAIKAMKQYNGVPLDGRPMNIALATSDVPTMSPLRKPRVAPVRKAPMRRPGGGGGSAGAPSRGGPPRRGGGKPPTKGPAPTAEQLDAELDAYVNDMK